MNSVQHVQNSMFADVLGYCVARNNDIDYENNWICSHLRKDSSYLCHSMWTNDMKGTYMFFFPVKNFAN